MRTTLRKTLLALMVGVGMMGAVSVQAQTQKEWVFMGLPSHTIDLNEGTFSAEVSKNIDQTCANWAELTSRVNTFGYQYKAVAGKHVADADRKKGNHVGRLLCYGLWWNETKAYWHDSGGLSSAGSLICQEGQTFRYDMAQRTLGCYEWRDKCPEGTVNEGGVCVFEFPANDPLCDGKGGDSHGGVACEGDVVKPCVWVIPSFITDSVARKKTHACIKQHEQYHIDIGKEVGSYCVNGRLSTPYPNNYYGEWKAYEDTVTCVENAKAECKTQACLDQLETVRESLAKSATRNRNDYNSWGK